MKSTEMILQCTCEQASQDSQYGQGMRLHRLEDNAYVCVVCGTRRTLKAPEKEASKPEPKKK